MALPPVQYAPRPSQSSVEERLIQVERRLDIHEVARAPEVLYRLELLEKKLGLLEKKLGLLVGEGGQGKVSGGASDTYTVGRTWWKGR
jgi:hypothetical protein